MTVEQVKAYVPDLIAQFSNTLKVTLVFQTECENNNNVVTRFDEDDHEVI